MHAAIKSLVTASLILSTLTSFAAAGPLADFQRRQDTDASSSVPSTEGTLSAVGIPTSDPVQTTATATDTFSDISSFTLSEPTPEATITSTDDTTPTISVDESASPSPTDSIPTPNTSFTPFTGTFASAPPIVTEIGSFVSENPEDQTRSFTFTHPHSRPPRPTSTGYSGEGPDCEIEADPICDDVDCALVTLTITTRIPIPTPTGGHGYGGGATSTAWDGSAYPTGGEASYTWMSSGAVPTETGYTTTSADITSSTDSAEPTFTETMTETGGESTLVSSDSLPTSTPVDASGEVDPTISMPTPVSTPVDASGETDPTATSSDASETSSL